MRLWWQRQEEERGDRRVEYEKRDFSLGAGKKRAGANVVRKEKEESRQVTEEWEIEEKR